MKHRRSNFPFLFIFLIALVGCGGKGGTKKGSDLKGDDARSFLAGKESKYWVLDDGHDYYEYLQFDKNNSVIITGGQTITYTLNGETLTMKDYQDLTYKIHEISDDKLVMSAPGKDTLTFLYFKTGSEEDKKRSALIASKINPKWLRGQYGTTWKFSEGGKMYSYMNDGKIIDANLLTKIADWKVDDKLLHFNQDKLLISRLTPIFFDYDAFGIPVKMNYVGEANPNGSLKQ